MKIRVLLAIPDLMGLGVQHDVRCLMQNWNKEKFDVRLLIHNRSGDFADQFPIDMSSLHVDEYSLQIPKLRFLTRLSGYRKLINKYKPHVIISFVPYCNYACAWAKFTGSWDFIHIVSEHAHVTGAMRDPQNMGNVFMKFYRYTFSWVYNNCANVVKCISKESMDDLIENHKINPKKIVLIHNPVPFSEIKALSKSTVDHPWFTLSANERTPIIINVGRLVLQKRQDLLLRAFRLVLMKVECNLVIVGDGTEEIKLRNLARDLGLIDYVFFAGFQKNPWKFIAKSDCFALTSSWEGLPCVLTESMVLGIPIVSVRCPSGPKEMLLEGEAGYLCKSDDVEEIALQLIEAIENPLKSKNKVNRAYESLYRFDPLLVTQQYEALVEDNYNLMFTADMQIARN